MNPADVRAILALELRAQEIKLAAASGNTSVFKSKTWDEYLQQAQYIMEASWKLPHPAGMDTGA